MAARDLCEFSGLSLLPEFTPYREQLEGRGWEGGEEFSRTNRPIIVVVLLSEISLRSIGDESSSRFRCEISHPSAHQFFGYVVSWKLIAVCMSPSWRPL